MCVGMSGGAKNVISNAPLIGAVSKVIPTDFKSNLAQKKLPGLAGVSGGVVAKNDNLVSKTGLI